MPEHHRPVVPPSARPRPEGSPPRPVRPPGVPAHGIPPVRPPDARGAIAAAEAAWLRMKNAKPNTTPAQVPVPQESEELDESLVGWVKTSDPIVEGYQVYRPAPVTPPTIDKSHQLPTQAEAPQSPGWRRKLASLITGRK